MCPRVFVLVWVWVCAPRTQRGRQEIERGRAVQAGGAEVPQARAQIKTTTELLTSWLKSEVRRQDTQKTLAVRGGGGTAPRVCLSFPGDACTSPALANCQASYSLTCCGPPGDSGACKYEDTFACAALMCALLTSCRSLLPCVLF